MRNLLKGCVVSFAGVVLLACHALAQTSPPPKKPISETLYDRLAGNGTGGAAPHRELTGFWAGLVEPKLNEVPSLTAWGQEQFRLNKSVWNSPLSESNDPSNGCDPLGFPRNMLYQTRGIAFAQMPGRLLELFLYNKVWREIWTDGRALPKNVGGTSADTPDPTWYGYSVGHWDGDYTFVVDTVGSDERSWLDNYGHPHSVDMRVQERYTRVNHNTLEVTITIDDPKTYTKPFVITKSNYRWIPQQEFEEQICVPSEQSDYLKMMGDSAAHPSSGK